jgi:2-keto-4-pentenoate hydratase/2-oxohepta-3-ene-1,7-dioic acid hydratase in catechol pathway
MKIVRFLDSSGRIQWGVDHGDHLELAQGDLEGGFASTGKQAEIARRLAPVVPAAFLCTGLNYRDHATETKSEVPQFPVLFMKSPSAVQDPDQPIEIPTHLPSTKVDFEAELAIVIGRKAKNVRASGALDYVAGFTCANDVSARDWQKDFSGSQWCRGKTFDTFAPLGPVLVTPDELTNPGHLSIRSIVNGQVMQDGNTSDLIFDIPALIEFYSGSTTLMPGTVILTGTPSGVGMARNPPVWLQPGDEVTISIEGIGDLTNPVILEPAT